MHWASSYSFPSYSIVEKAKFFWETILARLGTSCISISIKESSEASSLSFESSESLFSASSKPSSESLVSESVENPGIINEFSESFLSESDTLLLSDLSLFAELSVLLTFSVMVFDELFF